MLAGEAETLTAVAGGNHAIVGTAPTRTSSSLAEWVDGWVRELDPARRKSTITVQSFAAIGTIGVVGMAVAAFAPGPRWFFALDFWAALGWFVPPIALGFPMGILEARRRLSLRTFGFLSLIGIVLFQSYMWSLVALTKVPGSTVMAAFPVLLVCFHGHLYQSRLKRPLPVMASLLALGVGIFIAPDPEHRAILWVAGPMAIGAHLLLGYYATLDFKSRTEREALRAAVDAQLLNARTSEAHAAVELLSDLRERNHDAGNALAGALMQLPRFISRMEQRAPDGGGDDPTELGHALLRNLQRLKVLLLESSRVASDNSPTLLTVRPSAVVAAVLADINERYPEVAFAHSHGPGLASLQIPFFGGEEALYRVVTNLVLNACEGNGTERATQVDCEVLLDADANQLVVRISDNGPGFSDEQLLAPLDKLDTTKASGTGLGFYTASRIVAASGGRVTRENRAERRGAAVTIRLRVELRAP